MDGWMNLLPLSLERRCERGPASLLHLLLTRFCSSGCWTVVLLSTKVHTWSAFALSNIPPPKQPAKTIDHSATNHHRPWRELPEPQTFHPLHQYQYQYHLPSCNPSIRELSALYSDSRLNSLPPVCRHRCSFDNCNICRCALTRAWLTVYRSSLWLFGLAISCRYFDSLSYVHFFGCCLSLPARRHARKLQLLKRAFAGNYGYSCQLREFSI
jgi:hypothetical protein